MRTAFQRKTANSEFTDTFKKQSQSALDDAQSFAFLWFLDALFFRTRGQQAQNTKDRAPLTRT